MTDSASPPASAGPQNPQSPSPDAAAREFDVLLLGATGVSGAYALHHLNTRADALGATFAVGARHPDRVAQLCRDDGIPTPVTHRVDASDRDSVLAFARRGRVLVNLAGPYTPHSESVIDACVEAGTSYLDLSAEIAAIRRVDRDWDDRARDAGVAIVRTSGFEALPFDLAVDAIREGFRARGEQLVAAEARVRFRATAGGAADAISGGTLHSMLEVLRDRCASDLADPASRVPAAEAAAVRGASPLRLWPRVSRGVVVAPLLPFPFINPPVLHRTASLRAAEHGGPATPFRYREGNVLGPALGPAGAGRLAAALLLGRFSALLAGLARMPHPLRRAAATLLGRLLPPRGAGPRGGVPEDWRWTIEVQGRSTSGTRARVEVEAVGDPGYRATGRMIAELALLLAERRESDATGCVTPAIAAGTDAWARFTEAGVRIRVTSVG